ncbi:retrotransposon protein, putative, ty3-gypsy subclass [Tanacetum coccineum]
MSELTSHGGTMAASLRHQWRDTICGGGVYGCILDPAFTAEVAQEVADLLPTLTAGITDEIRQNKNNGNNGNRRNSRHGNPGGPGNDGDAQPTDIHVWLERFRKEKPQTFSSASTPVEAENWIAHIEKIFEVLGCDDQFKARLTGFLGAKVGTQEEQAKHFEWGLNDFVLDRILNNEFTDVAQVANAARNIEIFCDRPKNEGDNKRDRDSHHMATMADMATGTDMALTDDVVIDRVMTDMVMVVTDKEMVAKRRGVTKISRFRANIIVVLIGNACHRATGACFECGEVGHLAKDCKKGSTSSEGKRFGTLSFKIRY